MNRITRGLTSDWDAVNRLYDNVTLHKENTNRCVAMNSHSKIFTALPPLDIHLQATVEQNKIFIP